MSNTISVFTTSEGKSEVLQAYQAVLDHWPVPYNELMVPTSFGETHVITSGPEKAPPVILLHALLATATAWYQNVEGLSQTCRVYAIDIIGEDNKSRPAKPIKSLDDFLLWFSDLIDGLGIDMFSLIGNSYGGFTSAYFAMKLPDRVRKLVLIGPAATIYNMTPFYIHMFVPKAIYLIFPKMPGLKRVMRYSVDWMHAGLPFDLLWEPLFYRSMMFGSLINQVFPRVYSKEEFSRIKSPVLLVLGDKEVIYKPQLAVQAAKELIPNIQVEVIPNAHHITALAQPDIVNERILRFLAE